MSKYLKISIITPSYNQGEFIERTIQSVLAQNYPNLEYIIIDGDSTDNSVDIIKKYEDKVTYWVSEPDKGQADAINKGFEIATGDIVAWLNSDDTYKNDVLKKVDSYFNKNSNVDVIYGNGDIINTNEKIVGFFKSSHANFKKWLYHGNINVFQPGTFFRRNIIDKIGLLDDHLYYNFDTDYWLRIANKKIKMLFVNENFANLRWHDKAKTYSTNVDLHKKLHLALAKKYSMAAYLFYLFRHILFVKLKKKILGNIRFPRTIEGQRFFE